MNESDKTKESVQDTATSTTTPKPEEQVEVSAPTEQEVATPEETPQEAAPETSSEPEVTTPEPVEETTVTADTPVAEEAPVVETPEAEVADSQSTESTEPAEGAESTETVEKTKRPLWVYVAGAVVVVLTILIILFMLEKEGRSNTGVFNAYFENQAANAVVAVVNGEEIIGRELNASISQFTQVAFAQGIDISNPQIQEDIKEQSLDVLLNTELLKQEAERRGLGVEVAEAEARLEQISSELGGEEALEARIDELGMDAGDLVSDIQDEMLIELLLDEVFAEADITITDEEVEAVYEQVGGESAGLPALEEVRAQVEAQIQASKEQETIDSFLRGLREGADIETF
jgi:hypothetical protein